MARKAQLNGPNGAPAGPEVHTPDKFPDPWLADSEYLLQELARIRGLALAVPLTTESYGPTNTVVDAVWRLEDLLRSLLQIHRQAQRSFARKHAQKPAVVALRPAARTNHA